MPAHAAQASRLIPVRFRSSRRLESCLPRAQQDKTIRCAARLKFCLSRADQMTDDVIGRREGQSEGHNGRASLSCTHHCHTTHKDGDSMALSQSECGAVL